MVGVRLLILAAFEVRFLLAKLKKHGKTYSSSPFFPWDPQKSVSKAKNYSILGLGFASLHNHAEVRKKQLGYVMAPAQLRWIDGVVYK